MAEVVRLRSVRSETSEFSRIQLQKSLLRVVRVNVKRVNVKVVSIRRRMPLGVQNMASLLQYFVEQSIPQFPHGCWEIVVAVGVDDLEVVRFAVEVEDWLGGRSDAVHAVVAEIAVF